MLYIANYILLKASFTDDSNLIISLERMKYERSNRKSRSLL